MPTTRDVLGWESKWFAEALATAEVHLVGGGGRPIKTLLAPYYLATKISGLLAETDDASVRPAQGSKGDVVGLRAVGDEGNFTIAIGDKGSDGPRGFRLFRKGVERDLLEDSR